MYVVANIGPAGRDHLWLYAIDIVTGADKLPPSQLIFPGAAGEQPSTPLTIQRAALLIAGSSLYIGVAYFRPDGTNVSQDGFVFRYALADIAQHQARVQVTPTGLKGGIWQAGRGLSADSRGYIFASTAGGTYDGVTNFGSSILKLNPSTLSVADWFTPPNHEALYHGNIDLSAGGTIIVPNTNLLIAGGKEGVIYLLDRMKLGRLETPTNHPVQSFDATNGCGMTDCSQSLSTAYWDRTGSPLLFVWDRRDVLRAFSFQGGLLGQNPVATGLLRSEMAGGITVSSNGSTVGSGVVWAITAAENANATLVPATLRAYDAADIATELWNSDQNASRDAMGFFSKFSSPVVANGKVYAITHSNRLDVYGPLCGVDVTDRVNVTYGEIKNVTGTRRYQQTLMITNVAPGAFAGPIDVVVDNLAPGVTLTNATGTTTCSTASGKPYRNTLSASGWLRPNIARSVTLQFTLAVGADAITYTPRVIAGSGAR
jgi:hypothetical protein